MRITRKSTGETIQLEDGFFWSDENWSEIEQNQEYAISGALIIQEGRKQAGRPITLQPANKSKGWIKLRTFRSNLRFSLNGHMTSVYSM